MTKIPTLPHVTLTIICRYCNVHRGNTVQQCLNTLEQNDIQWVTRDGVVHVTDSLGKQLSLTIVSSWNNISNSPKRCSNSEIEVKIVLVKQISFTEKSQLFIDCSEGQETISRTIR